MKHEPRFTAGVANKSMSLYGLWVSNDPNEKAFEALSKEERSIIMFYGYGEMSSDMQNLAHKLNTHPKGTLWREVCMEVMKWSSNAERFIKGHHAEVPISSVQRILLVDTIRFIREELRRRARAGESALKTSVFDCSPPSYGAGQAKPTHMWSSGLLNGLLIGCGEPGLILATSYSPQQWEGIKDDSED